MIGRIIGAFSCLLCAFPFFLIPRYSKESNTPIAFWSGDSTLKEKVTDVPKYNAEMASLYQKYAISFLISAIAFAVAPEVGIVLLCLNCTVGIYLLYRCYKKILARYS